MFKEREQPIQLPKKEKEIKIKRPDDEELVQLPLPGMPKKKRKKLGSFFNDEW